MRISPKIANGPAWISIDMTIDATTAYMHPQTPRESKKIVVNEYSSVVLAVSSAATVSSPFIKIRLTGRVFSIPAHEHSFKNASRKDRDLFKKKKRPA